MIPTLSFLYKNKSRVKILKLLRKNKNITLTGIQKIIGIDYRAVWQHLEVIEKAGLVKYDWQEHKKGQPKYIIFNEKRLRELEDNERKQMAKHFSSSFPEDIQIKVLQLLKKEGTIKRLDFNKKLFDNGFPDVITFLITKLIYEGEIEEHYKISEKGKKRISHLH